MEKIQVFSEESDVNTRLEELGLNKEILLEVCIRALASAANSTQDHAANAWGTFSYHEGVFALRNLLRDSGWTRNRDDGIETVKNEVLNIRIGFCNVDCACDPEHDPAPRSPKGAGTERACDGNLDGNLFNDLSKYVSSSSEHRLLYYLLVDQKGAAELSCFTIKNGKFSQFRERIFLSDGKDLFSPEIGLDEDEKIQLPDFEPIVKRK